jgi:uncharacterized phage protein (TIGR01671 family)
MNNRFNFRMWDINTKRFYYMYLDELIGLTRTISIPKEATIQQYTGLTDSNDKEIYEGDILMYKSGSIPTTGVIGQVLYEADEGGYIFQWERKGPNQHHINLNCDVAFESVIIGNIFEHSELLN